MWAIYWRFFLAVIVVFLLTVSAVNFLPILQSVPNPRYHPSVFWLVASSIAMASSQLTSQGLIFAFFGKRMQRSPVFWGRLSFYFFGLFASLAALALFAQAVLSPTIWAAYKLYFQPVVLILGPLVAGGFVLHQVKHNKPL